MASPSISIHRILAASPATTRGQSTHLSADRKGKRIAYPSGSSIFVRSIDDPADCREYTGHQHPTTVARFSPNGFKVASGDSAGILRVWEPESIDTTRGEYSIISGPLQDIAWDGDSQRLIAVGNGRNSYGRCITADSGNTVGDIQGHTKPINAVAIKEKRPYRAVTVGDDSNAVFYTGVPFTFKASSALHAGFIFAAAYSPDGSRFVTVGQDKRIQLYDGTTGEPTKQIGQGEHSGSIFGAAWSEDGKRLATASADQTVKLWDVDAGTVVQAWRLGQGVSVRDYQVGVVIPHGRADGLVISVNLAGELTYLQPGKAEPVRVVHGHDKGITAITAASDGKGGSFLTGSFDGRVCRWDARTGIATLVDGQSHTNQVAQLVAGTGAGAGKIFSVGWDDCLRTVDESANTFLGQTTKLPGQPRAAAAHGGSVYVATSTGVAVYSSGGQLVKETALKYTPEAIAAHGPYVAVGGLEDSAEIFKTDASGALTRVAAVPVTLGSVSALAFSRDGNHLAVGNSVGKIAVYAAGSWELVTDRWSAHTARVTAIAWDDSGRYAASCSLDTNVFVWCLDKKHLGERIKAPNAHTGGATGVAWIEGGRVVSCGKDATVKIWDLKNLQ